MALCACDAWAPAPDGFTERDVALFSSMVFDAPPRDPGNQFVENAAAIALGQQLFFDQTLAFDAAGQPVSCVTCHDPRGWFSDTRAHNEVSVGVGVTSRNSPSLVNAWAYRWKAWDGRAEALWSQNAHAYTSKATMAGTRDRLLAGVRTRYACEFEKAFGSPPPRHDAPSDARDAAFVLVLKAWGAYTARLTSQNAPFDHYARGERGALTSAQKRGLALFIGKAACIECHRGPTFSDDTFRNIGIGGAGDPGRVRGLAELAALPPLLRLSETTTPAAMPGDLGAMRVKSLRNVAKTAPYFHAGQAATLRDVVWFYNQGGDRLGAGAPNPFIVPLGLTDDELADLEIFLGALTGEEVDARWTCDSSAEATRPIADHLDVTFVDETQVRTAGGDLVTAPPGGFLQTWAETAPDGGTRLHTQVFGAQPIARQNPTCAPQVCP